jgi:hypothetical protein
MLYHIKRYKTIRFGIQQYWTIHFATLWKTNWHKKNGVVFNVVSQTPSVSSSSRSGYAVSGYIAAAKLPTDIYKMEVYRWETNYLEILEMVDLLWLPEGISYLDKAIWRS